MASTQAAPASRLATPTWLDGRLALGVALVLASVVVGARVFAADARYTQVYVARAALVPGERLQSSDLAVGNVRFGVAGGSAYVAAASSPLGYVVTRYVGAGELLPAAAVAAHPSPAAATRLVTVPVLPGHLPADLGRGDVVDVYSTRKSAAGTPPAPPTEVLAGAPVDSYDDGSRGLAAAATASVVLIVPADQVSVLLHAVEGGAIDLVDVPGAQSGGSG